MLSTELRNSLCGGIFKDPMSGIFSHEGEADGGDSGVSSGTTIIACCFDGGVVVGADTRTSAGSIVVNRAARKISRIHDRIFVLRSGSAADTQAVTQIVKLHVMQHTQQLPVGEMPRVNVAATLFQSICYDYKDVLTAGLIVAGWDQARGWQIYSIPIGGTKLRVPYAAGGSGSVYVTTYMDANYKANMTKEECKALVKNCVAHAISRDGSSGGMIRITVITEKDVEEECIAGENNFPFDLWDCLKK